MEFKEHHRAFSKELKATLAQRKVEVDCTKEKLAPANLIAMVRERIEVLVAVERLQKLGENIKKDFKEVFEAIPHVSELPSDVYCRIKRKDTTKMIASRLVLFLARLQAGSRPEPSQNGPGQAGPKSGLQTAFGLACEGKSRGKAARPRPLPVPSQTTESL
jgi:hypothetical protein